MNLDQTIFFFINGTMTSGFLDFIMPVISNLVYFIPFLAGLVLWMVWKDGVRGRLTVAALILLVPLTDQISATVLKPAFGRPRPCRAESGLENVNVRARCSSKGSFPSSHATNIGGVALLLALRYRRWALIAGIVAFLVGFSRVYLGVHYPSDVLGGWTLGALLAGAVFLLVRAVQRWRWPEPEADAELSASKEISEPS